MTSASRMYFGILKYIREAEVIARELGFAYVFQDPVVLAQRSQGDSRVETEIDGLGLGLASLGQMSEGAKGGLERRESLMVCGPRRLPTDGIAKIADGLVPHFSAKRMIGEPFDVLCAPVRVETLDGFDDASVEEAAAVVEHSPIRDLVRQRVLERVFGLREELRLVDELRSLQVIESATDGFIRQLGDLLEDREGHVFAYDGGGLQETFVLRRETIDARRQHRLDRRGHLDREDRLRHPVPSAFPD